MCESCNQLNVEKLKIVTCHTVTLVAFVLSIPKGTGQRVGPNDLRAAAVDLVASWGREIFAEEKFIPPGEVAIRLTRKYALWAEKELRGVTMTPSRN